MFNERKGGRNRSEKRTNEKKEKTIVSRTAEGKE